MDNDPLDVLFEKTEEIVGESRKKLAKLVFPFIAIDAETGKLIVKDAWIKLSSAKKKILVVFLAQFALALKDPSFPNELLPKDIEDITGLPGGTVRPNVKSLIEIRLLKQNSEGKYHFRSSPVAIDSAYNMLESELNE